MNKFIKRIHYSEKMTIIVQFFLSELMKQIMIDKSIEKVCIVLNLTDKFEQAIDLTRLKQLPLLPIEGTSV